MSRNPPLVFCAQQPSWGGALTLCAIGGASRAVEGVRGRARYQDMGGVQLRSVNGQEVDTLAHLAEMLDGVSGEGGGDYFELELENSQQLVLDVEACKAAEAGILDAYGLTQPRSDDL